MKTKSFLLSLVFLFIFSNEIFSQKVRYGKIDKSDLEMTNYAPDPEADAVILYDSKKVEFIFDNNKGFQFQVVRHIRIKVFNKSGFDYIDFPITLYKSGGSYEKLTAFKAQTYNLVGGKVEKSKLANKDTFEEEVNKNTTRIKYAMPNLQEGSVVDISYSVLSDFLYDFTDWQYQFEIPVVRSDFFAEIPEYYIYKTAYQGYERSSITKNDITHGSGSSNYRVNNTPTQRDGQLTKTGTIDYKTKKYDWIAENVPAFKAEPYMAASSNYISKVNFELSGTDFPSSVQTDYSRTWENVRHTLMTDSDFGGRLNRKGAIKKMVEEITSGKETGQQKIAALYNYVQNGYEWNGSFAHYPRSTTREILDSRSGYSSDLNFLLLQMLRAAEIEAYPLSVSTRSNGFVNPVVPQLTDFNHVVAVAKIGDQFILMDVTGAHNPPGLLPRYDLNQRGRLFTETHSDWISLVPDKGFKTATQAKLTLDQDGMLQGTLNLLMSDYAALDFRNRLASGNEEETIAFLSQDEKEQEEGLEIISTNLKNVEDLNKKVTASYEVNISDKVIQNGDLLYLDPMLYFDIGENPFTSETRKFPVDLSTPIEEMYILQLTLPEGYVIDELPENIAFSLPEGAGRFGYEFRKVNDRMLQLTNRITIKKTFYLPEDYAPLREFFNLIIEKQGAQVVMKRAE
ncbi:MAG: DUF3857 domain-containing protein [Bacteroidetes bacterium]|nr:MAG: DUF3857 domain-containing protein [Bacteroidota bacterium]